MNDLAMMPRSRLVSFAVVAVAVVGAGCGPSPAWTPPPQAEMPVAPRKDEPRHAAGGGAAGAAASATATASPDGSSTAVVSAPPVIEAISGELPESAEAKLITHAVCKDRDCLVPGLYPSGAAADGGAPAAIWSHDLPEKGSAVTFPRHSGVDLFGVVLSGKVRVRPLEGGVKTSDLGKWVAFRAPGAGVSVSALDGAARIVFAVAGDGAPIAETAALLKDRKGHKQVTWSSRPGSVETVDLSAATDLAWAGGSSHARIGFEGKAKASFGLLLASKDAPVAQHQHDTSWEILAPLSADGTAKRASSAGATEMNEIAVTDGTVVAMPKATQHAWVPGGKKVLFAVQMYVPPGPEQRFKKLAADSAK